MRGRSTGIEVSAKLPNMATFRDGLMIQWKLYMSHEEALEAVGLSEYECRRSSSSDTTMKEGYVLSDDDGVLRLTNYLSWDQALQAVGPAR